MVAGMANNIEKPPIPMLTYAVISNKPREPESSAVEQRRRDKASTAKNEMGHPITPTAAGKDGAPNFMMTIAGPSRHKAAVIRTASQQYR
jgi:hypothetical protein